jgi:hypothetical protein
MRGTLPVLDAGGRSRVMCGLSGEGSITPQTGPAVRQWALLSWAKNEREQLQRPCYKGVSQHLPWTFFVDEVSPKRPDWREP